MNGTSQVISCVVSNQIKALLKSVITVPTTEFLHLELSHEPGFKSFPTLKLKNSRVGRGLISQVIPSAVTNVGC